MALPNSANVLGALDTIDSALSMLLTEFSDANLHAAERGQLERTRVTVEQLREAIATRRREGSAT